MKKDVKVTKTSVTVSVEMPPWRPGHPKVRVYEREARAIALEAHPKLDLGRCTQNCTVRSTGPNFKGEWVFEIAQKVVTTADNPLSIEEDYLLPNRESKTPPKTPPKKVVKKRTPKKEVINDKTDSSD